MASNDPPLFKNPPNNPNNPNNPLLEPLEPEPYSYYKKPPKPEYYLNYLNPEYLNFEEEEPEEEKENNEFLFEEEELNEFLFFEEEEELLKRVTTPQRNKKIEDDVFTKKDKKRLTTTSGNRALFLGPPRAGKSSTAKSVVRAIQFLTEEEECTVIADVLHWVPKTGNRTTFTFLDLGGHVSYRHSGHFFYINSCNNISLFFHDISSSSIKDTIWWIRSGLTKAPLSQVVIVVTKIDLIENEEERKQKIEAFKMKIKDFLRKEICRVSKIVERMKKTRRRSARLGRFESIQENYITLGETIGNTIIPVSCKPGFQDTITALKEHLVSIAGKPNTKVILAEEDCELYLKIGVFGIHDSEDGNSSGSDSSSESDEPPPDKMHVSKRIPGNIQVKETEFLQLKTVIRYFEEILKKKGLPIDNIKKRTQRALENLHTHGLITYYLGIPSLEDIVFNDIKTLVKLLETVFHHNIREFLRFETLPHDAAVRFFNDNQTKFNNNVKDLEQNGTMSLELLKALLQKSKCAIEAEAVIRLLEQLEVGFPFVPDGSNGEHVFIPFFVEREIPEDELNRRKTDLQKMGPKKLSLHGKIRGDVSQPFFHFLVVRVYKEIHNVKHLLKKPMRWSNCFFVELAENNTKLLYLLNGEGEVEFFFQGSIETVAQHRSLFDRLDITYKDQEQLSEIWWSGLVPDVILICTNCKRVKHDGPCEIPLDEVIGDDSTSDHVFCEKTEERLPRGMMLPLSKDEGAATRQLKELHEYLYPATVHQMRGEVALSQDLKPSQLQSAVRDAMKPVVDELKHEMRHVGNKAHDLHYECQNSLLAKCQTLLEENLEVTDAMLSRFVSDTVISLDDKTVIQEDITVKGKVKRLLVKMDQHGNEAVEILVNYLKESAKSKDNELGKELWQWWEGN